PSSRPTRVRYSILGMLCLLAMITYLDRAMYGSFKGDMMEAVNRPVADFFWVLTAFQIAYALFEIPTGYLGDRFGPRKTILRLVLWWSFFVAFTPAVGLIFPTEVFVVGSVFFLAFAVLILAEFFFGMGEAGAFPNITRALYNWFPATERGFAQGSIWLSARFMGGLTPCVAVILVSVVGLSWRQALWVFAGLAVVWCAAFYLYFRNRPDEHPGTNAAERELIDAGRTPQAGHHGVPWGRIFSSRNVWALCAMYMVTNFNWYFLMYNLPNMLKARYADLNATTGGKIQLALLGGAPMLVGMAGCLCGGLLTDQYIRRTGDRKWGRRIFAMIGYGMAGLCYFAARAFTGPDSLWPFAICLMLVGFFNDFIMGPSWAAAQDIGRRYSAIVSGTMNMVGNLGAVLGIQVTGHLLKYYTAEGAAEPDPAAYGVLFLIYMGVYFAGVGLWLLIDASKPIATGEAPEHQDYREPGAQDR
ncbi:MAG TPA: MFS transporter, partial [Gemmataceae bacterium]|nr:MFS transporter [Gemmataceae bacterium]